MQAAELHRLVASISDYVQRDILIYTGYKLSELESLYPKEMDAVKKEVAAIVDGEYVEELNKGKGLMGSENQDIHVFSNFEKYNGARELERRGQTFLYGGQILYVGLLDANEDQDGRE